METARRTHGVITRLDDERGVVLPTAMIVLIILAVLTIAFVSLATTEPVIARNHTMNAQARAFAESGLERAMWALTNPTDPNGLATPFTGNATGNYDGNHFLTVSTRGGFTVVVTDGTSANQKSVITVGWAPDSTGQMHAAKKIQATVSTFKISTLAPPCALCVMGTLDVGGNGNIDARSGHCSGSTPQGGSMTTGATTVGGNGKVYGPGNNTANEPGSPSPDTPSAMPGSAFSSTLLTADDFAMLRQRAQAAGTYFQGAQTFDNIHPLPNGIVFVDTTTGADFTATTPNAEVGSAAISGNHTWSGWLIVAGSISVSGTVNLHGLLYAQNDTTFTGNGTITGAVITENRKDTVATVIDSTVGGSANITYDCTALRTGGGTITNAWSLVPGTYREIDGR